MRRKTSCPSLVSASPRIRCARPGQGPALIGIGEGLQACRRPVWKSPLSIGRLGAVEIVLLGHCQFHAAGVDHAGCNVARADGRVAGRRAVRETTPGCRRKRATAKGRCFAQGTDVATGLKLAEPELQIADPVGAVAGDTGRPDWSVARSPRSGATARPPSSSAGRAHWCRKDCSPPPPVVDNSRLSFCIST